MDLRAEQLAIYQAVKRTAPRSFVRICKEDCALWVSDLPRQEGEPSTTYWQRVADQAKKEDCFTVKLK